MRSRMRAPNPLHIMSGQFQNEKPFATALHRRGVVRVSGADALAFLQNLVTNDLDGIAPRQAVHAGLLTPQGKISFEFFVVQTADGLLLDTLKATVVDLVKRLSLYRLRSKVTIEDVSAAHTVIAGTGDLPAGAFEDPRVAGFGWRRIVPASHAASDVAAYDRRRLTFGLPELGEDFMANETFPHEALYDSLSGVSFKKGCFVGQEIVSRTEHRGMARSRFVPVSGPGELPARGTPLTAGDETVGTMGSHVGTIGLALVRLDRLEKAAGITASGQAIKLHQPKSARFTVPGAVA